MALRPATSFVIGLLAVAAICPAQGQEPGAVMGYTDADAYAVYTALDDFKSQPMIVIQQDTTTVQSLCAAADDFPSDWRTVITHFLAENSRPLGLFRFFFKDYRRFRGVTNIELEIKGLQHPPHFTGEWTQFGTEFPEADGFYRVSAVGFDPARTKAYVLVAHRCPTCDGSSHTTALEKTDGQWMRTSRPDVFSCVV